jgi:hypothetical protein
VNPRYRIYAAVGVGGVIVLLGAFMLLGGGGGSSNTAAPAIRPLHPVAKAKKAAAKKATVKKAVAKKATRKKAVAKKATRKKAVAKTTAKVPLAPPKAAAKTDPNRDGMPAGLSRALRTHSVVVVSLVVPGATVDQIAYQEAKAGAAKAGAGFVRIDATNNNDVEALSTLVDANAQPANRLLDAPAVLIFRRPQELYVRINGYIDAETVAQAAANAA